MYVYLYTDVGGLIGKLIGINPMTTDLSGF